MDKKYYEEHKETFLQRSKEYDMKNKEKYKEYNKKYFQKKKNREKEMIMHVNIILKIEKI